MSTLQHVYNEIYKDVTMSNKNTIISINKLKLASDVKLNYKPVFNPEIKNWTTPGGQTNLEINNFSKSS